MKASEIREHVRHVYRQSAALAITPTTYLDQLAEIALTAQRDGKTLQAAGSGGTTTAFFVFQNIAPGDILDLIDSLRTPCEQATVDLALSAIDALPVSVRRYRPDFSGACIR